MSCKIGTHVFVGEVCAHCGDTHIDVIYHMEDRLKLAEDLIAEATPLVLSGGHYDPEVYKWEERANDFLDS